MKAIHSFISAAAILAAVVSCSENESPRNPYVAPFGQFTEPILCEVTPTGWLAEAVENAVAPDSTDFKFYKAAFEATLDEAIPASLEDYFMDLLSSGHDLALTPDGVEAMLWTYSRTGNEALLDGALEIFETLPVENIAEYMKIPILLYGYTGNESYLNIAYNAEAEIADFASEDPEAVSDYAWTMGQFLLTTGHAHWADNIEDAVFNLEDAPASVYADYVSRMWLTGSHMNEVVAALYGPSEACFRLEDDVEAKIVEDTAYPSGCDINFEFTMSKPAVFPFTFRVPAWSKNIEVYVNGKPWNLGSKREKWESVTIDELNALEESVDCPECSGEYDYCSDFYTIERKFRSGDVVTLVLTEEC